jgi:NAD(P)-dependent dehydrogenase (short-subunit alcohol dehydrogenase family)
MKTALITGSNRGIGFEIARELAVREFQVWLSGRNLDAVSRATDTLRREHPNVSFLRLDVGDVQSIREALAELGRKIKQLDVLINNAGVLRDDAEGILTVSPDVVFETININALGALYVTQAAAPLLRSGSRVINVSSGAGQFGRLTNGYAPVYSVSKTLMDAITCRLADSLKAQGVAVNAVTPGWVRTDMGGRSASRSVEKGAETPVWLAAEAPIDKTGLFWHDKKVIAW